MKSLISNIKAKNKLGEAISPFLFLWKNLEITNSIVEETALSLLKEYNIPKVYLHILRDNWETIKIQEIKEFISHSSSTVPYEIQIFYIENIWRLTLAASNSLLKFFEEPWKQNIIFLSNTSESNILDTILSRVQIIEFWWSSISRLSDFYDWMIKAYLKWENDEILSFLYKNKLEKSEYLEFLENLLIYAKDNMSFIEFLEELNEDINLIKQSTLNARYITDKWLLKIK